MPKDFECNTLVEYYSKEEEFPVSNVKKNVVIRFWRPSLALS